MRNRNIQIPIRLSNEEYMNLMSKVEKSKMTRERYIRLLLNDCVPREAPPVDYYNLISELRRVGSNINQILRVANAKGFIDAPLLRKTIEDYKQTEKMIWDAFGVVKA